MKFYASGDFGFLERKKGKEMKDEEWQKVIKQVHPRKAI